MTSQVQPEEQQNQPQVPERIRLRDNSKFATVKIAVFQYLAVAIFLFLVAGFWDLQIQNPEFYRERADQNMIKSLPVLAPRGRILDRDGRVLVDNHSSWSLIISRENLKPEHIKPIAEGLGMDPADLEAKLRRFKRPKYEPMVLKQELTPGELAFVEAHRDGNTFPELELIHSQQRLYPKDGIGAHVVGYVGEISENELNTAEWIKYNQGDVIGKSGIERQYNELLTGIDGQRQVVVDNYGRERRVLQSKEAVPGKPLNLTIDLDLQAVAELTMENRRGAVVAMDPRSGEVLAMVSRPAFDPNKFTGRIKAADWKEIMENPFNPLLNRAIQAQLAPGSTFKPFVALAGLETGVITDDFKVRCPGGASFYGHYFKCHLRGGHGVVDLRRAISQSCDVFFYTVGNKLGIDTIAQYAEMAGFGQKTNIDLPQEKEGLMPSSRWKMRNYRQKWYAGETISVAIGQGAVTVTPLQLASAVSGLVTGGAWQRPHLVRRPNEVNPVRRGQMSGENLAKIMNGLYSVVNVDGTAARARIQGIEVCGKTGTAQLASNQLLKGGSKLARSMKDNAWFFGLAPKDNPEIVVVALFENGEHGNLAAPIVRDVIKAYFDKKTRTQGPPSFVSKAMPNPVVTPEPTASPVEE